MRIVVQRCKKSSVAVNNSTVGSVESGLNLLVCLEKDDGLEVLEKAAQKIINLRIFEDPKTGKMNQNIIQAKGELLVISQFTLSWRGLKGNRPSFDSSMSPELANNYFNIFCNHLLSISKSQNYDINLQKGIFGEHMTVAIENDGPVTFVLDF